LFAKNVNFYNNACIIKNKTLKLIIRKLYNISKHISSGKYKFLNCIVNIFSAKAIYGRGIAMALFNFLKEHSYTIVKMLINQIGMTVFGLMLAMATASNSTLLLITSVFSIGFYLCLLYMQCWDCGAKDKIRVDGGRLRYFPYKGILMSLSANVINIILGLLAVIGWIFTTDFAQGIPAWSANLYGVCSTIAKFIQAMYLGVIRLYMPETPFSLILIILPSLFASGLGYFMGLKERRLFGFAMPQKNTDDEKPNLK